MNDKSIKALTEFLEEREKLDVHGNSLLVYKDNEEIFRHYTGDVKRDTLFRIFSMTKVVTVVAALQLYELGKFAMDDHLADYIPEYKDIYVWDESKSEKVSATKTISIRDCFCMSTGIPYGGDWSETSKAVEAIGTRLKEKNGGRGYSTLEYVRALSEVPLAFEPGTHWMYGLSHDILAGLVEVISGMKFSEYLKVNIFEPLNMKNTFFTCPADKWDNIAYYDDSDKMDENMFRYPGYESGGGGLLSTLDDYMKFAVCLANGGTNIDGVRILGRKTVELMSLDQLNDEQKKDFNWDYLKGYSYGLGVRTMINPALSGIQGSVHEFGWCGMLGTWVLIDPKEKLAAVYMHQRFPNLEKYVQTHLRPLIYGML